MLAQFRKSAVRKAAQALHDVLSERKPIKLKNGTTTTEYQIWRVAFGNRRRGGRVAIATSNPITYQEILEDRFGTLLYQKLREVAPGRLFSPEYYVLEYHLPDAPFPVRVHINNSDEVRRAYVALNDVSPKELLKLAKMGRFKLIPIDPSKPVFNEEPEDLVPNKLKSTAALTSWLTDSFMAGRVTLDQLDHEMAQGPVDMRKDIYLMIPAREQPQHEYLNAPRKKKLTGPEDRYRRGGISLTEFEELKFPELRVQREKAKTVYPVPEKFYPCVICLQKTAQIQCMECENRVCTQCVSTHFIDSALDDAETFLLLHHIYCLKYGKPSLRRNRKRPEKKK